MNHPLFWSRILSSWIATVTIMILCINKNTDDSFYQWGPHSELVLFGVVVDSWAKYGFVVLYTFVNVSLRNVEQNILRPYLLLNVQSDSGTVSKNMLNHAHIYEITVLVTLYTWFDWFMYMQMLLTQVDMIFIEAAADVVVSLLVTEWYLRETVVMTFASSYQSLS
jgi:hypothetical protein